MRREPRITGVAICGRILTMHFRAACDRCLGLDTKTAAPFAPVALLSSIPSRFRIGGWWLAESGLETARRDQFPAQGRPENPGSTTQRIVLKGKHDRNG
jgi:hypothetical protein